MKGLAMLTADEMKGLVDEIVALGNELRAYHGHTDLLASPHPPASNAQLTAIRKRLGQRVPPSYLQLLSLYDGVDNFDWVDVSFLSTAFLLSHSDLDLSWVKTGNFAAGERFIFAQSETDPHAIAFLTQKINGGEMEVIDFDNEGAIKTYPNLGAYLRGRRDWFAKYVAREKAKLAEKEEK